MIALYNEVLVGGITTRKLQDKEGKTYLYIMTIGVLSAYRGRGIGTQLLQKVEEQAKADKDVSYIELHVQQGNDDALAFYAKHGYNNIELVENYYQKVTPSAAHRLTKTVTH
jgi:ribosomal protein S18 acetylase RimI-like enzyme